jgi:hypothetical protein
MCLCLFHNSISSVCSYCILYGDDNASHLSLSERSFCTTIVLFDEVKRKKTQITALWIKKHARLN